MAPPIDYGPGFHREEYAEGLPYRWMSLSGRLTFEPSLEERFLELWIRSSFHDLSQRLHASVENTAAADFDLVHGWNALSIRIPARARTASLAVNKIFPREYYPGDGRELAVQVRTLSLHADAARHGHITRQQSNAVLNTRELREGRTVLTSTPPKLGIDMTGACNVKPPCVYCNWDFTKGLEGKDADVPFTLETLGEYGAFFENSQELVNCSIGEPFMMKNVDELLDEFGRRGKILEITTNGQILTDANIQKLLGRPAHLYISLDAATAQTYAKLRNPTFVRLLDNVKRLIKAKGGRGRLPHVYLVFMPMKANAHEVDDFVRLCAELEADRLVLRPLNDSPGVTLTWDRAGYRFDYQRELLPFEDLVHISGRVAELCRQLGIDLSDQMEFGGSLSAQFAEIFEAGRREAAALFVPKVPAAEAAPAAAPSPPSTPRPPLGDETLPACTEPWTSLYILRRGTMPCCYGGHPIAPMAGFGEAWNGTLVREIRRELVRGRFHRYCFDSPDCPIVRKSAQARDLPLSEDLRRRFWVLIDRGNRCGWGWPGWAYRMSRHYFLNGVGRIKRILGRAV